MSYLGGFWNHRNNRLILPFFSVKQTAFHPSITPQSPMHFIPRSDFPHVIEISNSSKNTTRPFDFCNTVLEKPNRPKGTFNSIQQVLRNTTKHYLMRLKSKFKTIHSTGNNWTKSRQIQTNLLRPLDQDIFTPPKSLRNIVDVNKKNNGPKNVPCGTLISKRSPWEAWLIQPSNYLLRKIQCKG